LVTKCYQNQLANQARRLEEAVQKRTAELAASREEVILCLARAGEFRDNETGNHVVRVGKFVGIIARELGYSEDRVKILEQAAQLHDVGKIAIPDEILLKPGKLDPEEYEFMQRHCLFGRKIIEQMPQHEKERFRKHPELGARLLNVQSSPVLGVAALIALTHHEWWDGHGYPLGLAGEDIPIEGRMTAVADVFDALSTKRPYKNPIPRKECFAMMEKDRGTHFDPKVLDAFFRRRQEIIQVQIDCADLA
jgi:putative two-component system response regulator